MAITVYELQRFLGHYSGYDSRGNRFQVGIGDDGLSLFIAGTTNCIEVGGLPEEQEEPKLYTQEQRDDYLDELLSSPDPDDPWYPKDDWKNDILSGETILGYREWLNMKYYEKSTEEGGK